MARAAVRAKQAQQAQTQAAAKPRKQRRHAGGGNPSQDLFFVRLRRRQRWVFLGLAVLFAVSFTLLGVGSGTGGGLTQLWNGIVGGNDPVSQAQGEIKTNPTKGYQDLANAYVQTGDIQSAIGAMQKYLTIKKTDPNGWALLAQYQTTQAGTYSQQYQQIQQAAALAAPSSALQLTGKLANAFGSNSIDNTNSQQLRTLAQPILQNMSLYYQDALTSYENVAKYSKPADRPAAELQVASAARLAGNSKVGLQALQTYVKLSPNSPYLKQIEAQCKSFGGSCTPKKK